MTILQSIQAARDLWRPNRYEVKRYLVRDGREHPFAVICPGGGYYMCCSFIEGAPYAKELNRLGYHAFVVYYRTKAQARYPAPQEDLARAIREILAQAEQLKLDPRGYSLWGSSAGGHLAASLMLERERFDVPSPGALILSYPVVTMGVGTHMGSRDNQLGKEPAPQEVERLCVERQITPDYPPTYLWCGTADRTVDPKNSHMMADALQRQGVPCRFDTFAGVDHGVGLGKGLACEPWFRRAVAFWEAQR